MSSPPTGCVSRKATHWFPQRSIPFSAILRRLRAEKNLLRSWPDSLQKLQRLSFVFLHENGIMGDLTVLCHWREIRTIYLHNNKFKRKIPDCIGALPLLQVLTLHDNMLVGPIPLALGAMSHLQVLTLHDNALTGSIPKSCLELIYGLDSYIVYIYT